MDANKKVDLENVQCPSESKILMNIITNHPLRFSIAASASVPWIYMAQFGKTMREDDHSIDSRGNKNKVGMRIPPWMITEEMKLTEHYKMYAKVFGLDVPLIQSQPTESTQGTHRTLSAPRSPNPAMETAESSSREEQEARENVALVDEHLAAEEIEKLVEEYTNVDDSSPTRHDDTSIPGTRIEPEMNKESPEVEIVQEKEEETTKDTECGTKYCYTLTEQVKKEVPVQVRDQVPVYLAEGLILERKSTKEEMERLIAKAILQERGRMQAQISSQIQNAIDNAIPSLVDASIRNYMSCHILHVHLAQVQSSSIPEQQHQVYLAMKVDPLLQQQDIAIWLALQMKFEKTQVLHTACRPSAVRPRDQDDPHDDAHPEGENSAKRQKTSEYEAYVSGESSSGQVNVEEPGPSTSGNQEQDVNLISGLNRTLMHLIDDEIQLNASITRHHEGDIYNDYEAKMKNVQSCQRDPEAPALSLINQDLLYLKKGNSGPEKIVLSLHKFPAIVFNDDDIEERTSRWVNKCIKKFNPYARYGVENWKNPHAKIFYIRRQKEPGRPKEEIYSNSKIVQVIKTFWELGHEHKFITEIVARRANDCIVSIIEPDIRSYLNKNDIETLFIRSSVIWERVDDFQLGIESYQQKINLTAPTITFPGID
ncbi:hypothetical protein Tco_0277672 [Tanacetum coccineum]